MAQRGNNLMKKIIFIATRFPYPSENGREKTLLEYLSFIKGEYEVYFYYFDKEKNPKENALIKLYNIKEVCFIKIPSLKFAPFKILYYSILQAKKSIQESVFWSNNIKLFVRTEINRVEPNVIFADMIRTAQYIEDIPAFRIFDMDDIISKRYKYLLEHEESNILGYFNEFLPSIIKDIINKILRNSILKREAKLVQIRENILISKCNRTLLVSPLEEQLIKSKNSKYKKKFFSILPSESINHKSIEVKKIEYSMSFIGMLNAPHNEKGLIYFIENILSRLVKKQPETKLYIIGKNATSRLIQLSEQYKANIELTGFIDNPDELILKTQLMIAPIYFGTGIKIKILDSMSLGVPIVTTPIGSEGLLVKNSINILISKDDNEYLDNIIKIFNNSDFRDFIGLNSKVYIENYHNPAQLKKQFLNLLEES